MRRVAGGSQSSEVPAVSGSPVAHGKPAVSERLKALRQIDLNRLIIFMAIYECRSVSAAACVLGIKQPAVSAALAHLRQDFDDELFIRSGRGVAPTVAANAIAQRLAPALALLREMSHLWAKT